MGTNPSKVATQIERGHWRTRGGLIAIVNKQGAGGKWIGWVPGHFNRTLWSASGKHQLMTDYDLVERILRTPGI
jgi:hypothetical protein